MWIFSICSEFFFLFFLMKFKTICRQILFKINHIHLFSFNSCWPIWTFGQSISDQHTWKKNIFCKKNASRVVCIEMCALFLRFFWKYSTISKLKGHRLTHHGLFPLWQKFRTKKFIVSHQNRTEISLFVLWIDICAPAINCDGMSKTNSKMQLSFNVEEKDEQRTAQNWMYRNCCCATSANTMLVS